MDSWYMKWAAIVISAIVGVVAYEFVSWSSLESADWAAWVQAIFSVVAILAAWLTTRHQLLTQEKIHRATESAAAAEMAQACLALATDTCLVLENIAGKFRLHAPLPATIGTERLEELQFYLRAMAGKDIPARLYAQMLPLQREVAYTITAVRQQNQALGGPSKERIAKANRRAEVVSEAKEEIAITAARLISKAAALAQ
jgi:hypothetical protein